MNRSSVPLFVIFSVLCLAEMTRAIPAFPGAEGFGAQAVGGRGGQVLFVTNLNDSGPANQKPSMGCNIKWKPGAEPQYT